LTQGKVYTQGAQTRMARAARLPVSIKELLTLLEALKRDVIRPSINDFYYLSRATLVNKLAIHRIPRPRKS